MHVRSTQENYEYVALVLISSRTVTGSHRLVPSWTRDPVVVLRDDPLVLGCREPEFERDESERGLVISVHWNRAPVNDSDGRQSVALTDSSRKGVLVTNDGNLVSIHRRLVTMNTGGH